MRKEGRMWEGKWGHQHPVLVLQEGLESGSGLEDT